MSADDVARVVRNLGIVAQKVYDIIQSNLTSAGKYELAETVGDVLKPIVDMLLHFDDYVSRETDRDTEVNNEVP